MANSARKRLSRLSTYGTYGRKGIARPSYVMGTSEQSIIAPTDLSSPKQNCYLLTVFTLDQYLQNGIERHLLPSTPMLKQDQYFQS